MITFKKSYVITNRNNIAYDSASGTDALVPLSPSSTPSGVDGSMWFYKATGSYVCDSTQYSPDNADTPETKPPPAFRSDLVTDLLATTVNDAPQRLCVYMHGLGNPFGNDVVDLANLGGYLATYGGYRGLVIAFDWPSYGSWDSIFDYASSAPPPTATSGTIRDNINGSTGAFVNLMIFLQSLSAKSNVQVSFICHSEGNYMMMLGMQAVQAYLAANPGVTWQNLDQVILLAADINAAALYTPISDDPSVGWGAAIASLSNQVTIYYSSGDSVLEDSQKDFTKYHNPSQPDRLGFTGPTDGNGTTYGQAMMPANVVALDCSNVVNSTVFQVFQNAGYVPDSLGYTPHSFYMYCPQILKDITQTMDNVAAGSVVNRIAQTRSDGTGFTMTLVDDPPPPPILTPCTGSSDTTSPRDTVLLEALRAKAAKKL